MKNKDISIIITTHNYGQYIKQCIDSLCNQTLKPQEIIIIDDASHDDAERVIQKYIQAYKDIKIIYKKVDFCNAQESRKFGFNLATGKLILFVDADNYVDMTMLEKMTNRLLKNKSDLVYCNHFLIDEYGAVNGEWVAHKYSYTRLQRLNFIDMCSLCKREFLQENFFDKNIKRFQDWDVWLQYLNKDKRSVTYLQEKLIYKREHEGSISSNQEKYLERLKVMYKNDIIQLTHAENIKDKIFFQCFCQQCQNDSVDEYFYNLRKRLFVLRSYDLFIFTFGKKCGERETNVKHGPLRNGLLNSTKWKQLQYVIFSKQEMHDLLNATNTISDIYKKLLNK